MIGPTTGEFTAQARPWSIAPADGTNAVAVRTQSPVLLTLVGGLLGALVSAGWLHRPERTTEDGVARVASSGQLLLPGHVHGDVNMRLRGCSGCVGEFRTGVEAVLRAQRAQAAPVQSGGAR